jgi:hypothetical protein
VERKRKSPPAVYGINSQEMQNSFEPLYAMVWALRLKANYLSIEETVLA